MKSTILLSLVISIFLCFTFYYIIDRIEKLEKRIEKHEPEHLKITLTAYTLRKKECNNDLENTATMLKPIPGYSCAVSVDLKHLLGKKIYIYGYGVWYVNDLLNKRYKKSVDLLVWDIKTARKIGRKKDIEIVTIDKL